MDGIHASQHHQRGSMRQSPSTPTSQLPWHAQGPSSSKEAYGSPFHHPWNDYQAGSLYQQPQETLSNAHLYAHYTNPLGSSGFDGNHVANSTYDEGPLSASYVPAEGNFLLGRYELDVIGDDSGSGGTTRPKPKKRRKVASRGEEGEDMTLDRLGESLLDHRSRSSNGVNAGSVFRSHSHHHYHNGDEDEEQPDREEQHMAPSLTLLDESATVSSACNDAGGDSAFYQDDGGEGGEDEPLYVNPKQYNRILKRREVRAYMEEKRRRTEEAIRTGKLDVKKLVKGKEVAKVSEEDDKKVREMAPEM